MVHATALLHRHILLGRPPECCRLQLYSLLPCGLVDHICSSLLYILFLCRLPFFRVISRLCSSQPARDWKSCLFVLFMFFILIIVFWIENYHSLFIPVKFFMFFHSCSSSLWHVHFPFLCFENGPWSLGNAGRSFFSNLFVFFFFFVLAIFPPLPSKLTLEIVKRSFFSNLFRVFSFSF